MTTLQSKFTPNFFFISTEVSKSLVSEVYFVSHLLCEYGVNFALKLTPSYILGKSIVLTGRGGYMAMNIFMRQKFGRGVAF